MAPTEVSCCCTFNTTPKWWGPTWRMRDSLVLPARLFLGRVYLTCMRTALLIWRVGLQGEGCHSWRIPAKLEATMACMHRAAEMGAIGLILDTTEVSSLPQFHFIRFVIYMDRKSLPRITVRLPCSSPASTARLTTAASETEGRDNTLLLAMAFALLLNEAQISTVDMALVAQQGIPSYNQL